MCACIFRKNKASSDAQRREQRATEQHRASGRRAEQRGPTVNVCGVRQQPHRWCVWAAHGACFACILGAGSVLGVGASVWRRHARWRTLADARGEHAVALCTSSDLAVPPVATCPRDTSVAVPSQRSHQLWWWRRVANMPMLERRAFESGTCTARSGEQPSSTDHQASG